MTARHAAVPGQWFRLRTSGWIVSLCLHAGIIFLSAFLAANIGLISPSSSFLWDVTVVESHGGASVRTPAEASMAFPTDIKSNVRETPSNTARGKRSASPVPASPTLPAPTETLASRAAESVITPLPSESPRTLEHPPASPLYGDHPSDGGQSLSPQEAWVPLEPSAPSHPSQPAAIPQETEASPAFESSSSLSEPPIMPQATATPPQIVSLPSASISTPAIHKADYGWLAGSLSHRIEALKQYPASARLNHLEGRVIVRIVIEEDGRITSVAIAKSSGHEVLDRAALDTLRRVSPIALSRPLDKSQLTIQIPLTYRLDH